MAKLATKSYSMHIKTYPALPLNELDDHIMGILRSQSVSGPRAE
jgi:hypothetical protein